MRKDSGAAQLSSYSAVSASSEQCIETCSKSASCDQGLLPSARPGAPASGPLPWAYTSALPRGLLLSTRPGVMPCHTAVYPFEPHKFKGSTRSPRGSSGNPGVALGPPWSNATCYASIALLVLTHLDYRCDMGPGLGDMSLGTVLSRHLSPTPSCVAMRLAHTAAWLQLPWSASLSHGSSATVQRLTEH